MFVQFELLEKGYELFDRKLYQIRYILSTDLYMVGFFTKPFTLANIASGLTSITGEHDPVLYLITFFLQRFKELVNADKMGVSIPH